MASLVTVGLMVGAAALLASAALVPLVARRRHLAGWLNATGCLVAAGAFTAAGIAVLLNHPVPLDLPLGSTAIHLVIDGFAALFLVLIALMAALVAFYAIGYMDHYPGYGVGGFYVNYALFVLGMAGIVLVDDLSWGFSIAWQLMTISSFFLIRFDHDDRHIVRSANKYLALMELAWLLVVGGAGLLSGSFAGSSLGELAKMTATATGSLRAVALALVLAGFALKAGVFPLGQLWLPDAHSSAPSPISALLSGVMIKTGVYGIVRTLFWMVPSALVDARWRYLGLLLAIAGVASLFVGTVQALKQHDAKRLHAYHSIGQMGYIVLGVGTAHFLYGTTNAALQTLAVLALVGAVYHALNHAVFKSLLFLVTGSVQYATGTKDIDKLGGLITRMPATAVVAAIAAASIAGVPAFSGFVSKWAVISSSLLAGRHAPALVFFGVVALMTSAITLASYVKFFGMTFTSSGSEWHAEHEVREVPTAMLGPQAALAVLCLGQGLFPWVFLAIICRALGEADGSTVASLFSDPGLASRLAALAGGLTVRLDATAATGAVVMPLVLFGAIAASVLFAGWLRRAGGARARRDAPWMCGYQQLNDRNRYPSRNLYAAFKKAMRWTGADAR